MRTPSILALVPVLLAPPGAATACINAFQDDAALRGAELAVRGSDFQRAADVVLAYQGEPTRKHRLVLARAILRSSAAVRGGREKDAVAGSDPERHLAWAIAELAKSPIPTDVAEALAATPSRSRDAARALQELETADTLASGHGYAALLRLRRARAAPTPGWVGAAIEELERGPIQVGELRCKRLGAPSAVCEGTAPAGSPVTYLKPLPSGPPAPDRPPTSRRDRWREPPRRL